MISLLDFIGRELEYLGGFPDEKDVGIKKGDLLKIDSVRGCCFVINYEIELFGKKWDGLAEINHERFKKN